MRPDLFPARLGRLAAWVGCLCFLAAGVSPAEDEWEDLTLAPEVEKLWAERVNTARPLRLKGFQEHLRGIVERMAEEHGLTEEQVKVLNAAVPRQAKEALRHWEQSMQQLNRPYLKGDAKRALAKMKEGYQANWLVNFPAPYYRQPEVLDGWTEAVRQALPAEAFAKWEADKQRRLEERKQETEELVQAGVEKLEPAKRIVEALAQGLRAFVEDEAAGKDLDQKIEVWSREYAEACAARSRLFLDGRDQKGPTWSSARKRGYYLYWVTQSDWIEKKKSEWLAALPPEARKNYEAAQKARAERLAAAWRKMQVMIVEMMTPLSDAQRAQVEALAAELPVVDGMQMENGGYLEPWKEWREPQASPKLAAVLDNHQERLWAQGIQRLQEMASGYGGRTAEENAAEAKRPPRHPALGPADHAEVETAISEHLAADSQRHARRGLQPLLRRADEAARAAGLDEAARAELELAAKGTLQERVEEHRQNQARYIRGQMEGATPQNIRQRLKGVGGYSFYSNRGEKTLFDKSLGALLNEEQKTALKKFQEATLKRRHEAMVALLLALLDKELGGLTTAQHDKLAGLLTEVMEKYGQDIEQMFAGWGERAPWFLQSYYLSVPAAGVPEAELKKVFGERQMQLWENCVNQRGGHYWSQVLEQHEMRKQGGGRQMIFFEQ